MRPFGLLNKLCFYIFMRDVEDAVPYKCGITFTNVGVPFRRPCYCFVLLDFIDKLKGRLRVLFVT